MLASNFTLGLIVNHPEASCDGRFRPPLSPEIKNIPPVPPSVPEDYLAGTPSPSPVMAPLQASSQMINYVQQTQAPSQMSTLMTNSVQQTQPPSQIMFTPLTNYEQQTQPPPQMMSTAFMNSTNQTQASSHMIETSVTNCVQQNQALPQVKHVQNLTISAQQQPMQQFVADEQSPTSEMHIQPNFGLSQSHIYQVEPESEDSGQLSPVSVGETSLPYTNQGMMVTSMASLQTTNTPSETVMLCSLPQKQVQHAVILPPHTQVQSTSHMAPMVGVVDVPVLSDSEGEYGFQVTVEDKERTTKSPMWLMSRITNKLYTNINKAVPFEISLKKPIDISQFSIRAVPVFSSPQFLRTNVNRCPNHAAPADATNHDFPFTEHVVRADHPGARYVTSSSGRLSVVVPLDTLQDGSEYTPILLRFMCLGSCVGGINRRPIAIILTLENRVGEVCGRKMIDVRVCACPTRDIKTDEQTILNKGGKRKGSTVVQEKVSLVARKKPRTLEPKTEPQDDDDKMFYIPVRGHQLYNFLLDMKAVYYCNHPDYAAKYPDDNTRPNRFSTRHISGENFKERSDWRSSTEEMEVNTWDSEADSPHQVTYDDNHTDSFGDILNTSPSAPLQSQFTIPPRMKLMVVGRDRNGVEHTGAVNTQNNDIKAWSQTTEAVVSSSQLSPVTISTSSELHSQGFGKLNLINHPKVTPKKHVPVVQVSSYKPREFLVKRSASEYRFGNIRQPVSLSRSSSLTHKQYAKDYRKPAPVKLETESLISREDRLSHGSPEMIAANVLVEGFAKEKNMSNK
ncbi:uncharacterized protein LOC121865498 isoform X1 [Homarus americanus]|nr:uncharacterized protein LOC121865498 isoform X1 [Homarus americanus]